MASTIALTSRWPHSGVDELVEPAGQQVQHAGRDVGDAGDLAEVAARAAASARETSATTVLPAASAGGDLADQPEQVGLVGREHGDDAGRLRASRSDRYGAATGLIPPITAGELVGPARVVHERVDRGADLGAGGRRRDALLRDGRARQLVGARLERLGEAVEDLPAVVGGRAPPSRPARRARP